MVRRLSEKFKYLLTMGFITFSTLTLFPQTSTEKLTKKLEINTDDTLVRYVYIFKNTTKTVLTLKNISVGCGSCTNVSISKTTFSPGEENRLVMNYSIPKTQYCGDAKAIVEFSESILYEFNLTVKRIYKELIRPQSLVWEINKTKSEKVVSVLSSLNSQNRPVITQRLDSDFIIRLRKEGDLWKVYIKPNLFVDNVTEKIDVAIGTEKDSFMACILK